MKTEDPKLSTYFSNKVLLTVCSTVQALIYWTEFPNEHCHLCHG